MPTHGDPARHAHSSDCLRIDLDDRARRREHMRHRRRVHEREQPQEEVEWSEWDERHGR
jgi:hypothetical protein